MCNFESNREIVEWKKMVINDVEACKYSKFIEVKNDNFLFEILREREIILLVNTEPVSVVWHDQGPSSVHFYTIHGIAINEETKKET